MKNRSLGNSTLTTSVIGIGCNRLIDLADQDAVAAIDKALELGVNHFDTAESYGNGRGEEFLGALMKGRRDRFLVASKFGFLGGEINGRPDYVRTACDRSLSRLKTGVIDLYYQHRVDPDVPIEDTWGALSDLVDAGKVRTLGISRATPEQIRRAHAVHPVSALQSEYSLFTREVEADVLPVCDELGITFVAYGPLAFAFLGGGVRSNTDFPEGDRYRRGMPRFSDDNVAHNYALLDPLKQVAGEVNATPAQVALAWLTTAPADIMAIPGSRKPGYVIENAAAADIELSPAQRTRLDEAFQPGAVKGGAGPGRR